MVDQFEKYDTKFGKMTCGMLPVSGNTPIGQWVGALPSGRNAKTPLTDGIGATGGTDVNGPTALLKSVSHIPHARFTQGTQLNMKFEPEMLRGEDGIAHGMNMLKTMCMLDVYHAQINCVDRATLIDAQKHPDQHRDLLIRVAGYTAFFVELGKETQDEIIGRTEINTWAGRRLRLRGITEQKPDRGTRQCSRQWRSWSGLPAWRFASDVFSAKAKTCCLPCSWQAMRCLSCITSCWGHTAAAPAWCSWSAAI